MLRVVFAGLCVLILAQTVIGAGAQEPLRPPAVPLVACDPYFSIWSAGDRLTDVWPTHWTGRRQAMASMVRIDGKPLRLMGIEPADVPALPQVGLEVLPTRTIYQFQDQQVRLTLTFTTAALPDDLDVLSRPVTYLTWEARSNDGREHAIWIYFDASAELAVNVPEQAVEWSRPGIGDLAALRIGTVEQRILAKKGDDLRIDWGYAYAAAPPPARAVVMGAESARKAFALGQPLAATDDQRMPRAAKDDLPTMAFVIDLGGVGAAPVARHLILAYDDLYSIKFLGSRLRPFWRRNGAEAADLLTAAERDYPKLIQRCETFDDQLMRDLETAGGDKYARICALAYRQCLAGNKIAADANGMPLVFPKENFSNGCIATVDVIYPMAPQFLLFSPALAKGSLAHIMEYANSPRWRFPFAPHDLGTYPIAGGQVYGAGERGEENQMPVEESGNMLLLLAAVAKTEGNVDFAVKYWPLITRWAEYLRSKGFDPENQLCTDDFAGHLAHNVNLSAKAICALGAYAMMCDMAGKKDEASNYRKIAEEFVAKWVQMANDGNHYRLAFDKPNTWSQKYNLVWDRVLALKLFPEQVTRTELAWYRKVQNRYGLPLDSRRTYTKLDWITWSAALTGSRDDFDALIAPIYEFLQASPSRIPMTDWYETKDARKVGFQARPVIGAVFIRMLDDPALWKKWAGRGAQVGNNFAPLPAPPQVRVVVPTSQERALPWKYTFQKPADGWHKPDFNDSAWAGGPAGFGTRFTPGSVVRTEWNSADIWLRRTFSLSARPSTPIQLLIHHDEDAEIYINGVLAAQTSGYTTEYDEVEIGEHARAALKAGSNTMAVHCHQTTGGQYIDVGLVELK